MDAHQIIDSTMERGEGEKLARMTGKSADLFNSYRRPPRTSEQPFGTGNYSPVYYYLQFCELRKAINPEGVLRMHRLVTAEIEDGITDGPAPTDLRTMAATILTRATESVNGLNETELKVAGLGELRNLDETLGRLHSALDITRAALRAELRRREVSSLRVEPVAS